MGDEINIEVVYALPERQERVSMRLPVGSTLQTALEASGLLRKYPDIGWDNAKFGVYGRISAANTVLRDRDRVEIYRPLSADPKEVRRRRAAEVKAARKGPEGAP